MCTNNVVLTMQYPTMLTSSFLGPHIESIQQGSRIFPKFWHSLSILGATGVNGSKFHTQDQQTLYTTIQNLVTQATSHPGYSKKKIISHSYKFYLNQTDNQYTYITANPCHLQGLHSWKIQQTVKLSCLMLRPHKKLVYGNSETQNVVIYNAMLNKDKNILMFTGMTSMIQIKVIRMTEWHSAQQKEKWRPHKERGDLQYLYLFGMSACPYTPACMVLWQPITCT